MFSMAIEFLRFFSIPELLFAASIIFLKPQSDWLSDISKLDDLVVISLFQQINYGHQPFRWSHIIRKPKRFESQSERTPYDQDLRFARAIEAKKEKISLAKRYAQNYATHKIEENTDSQSHLMGYMDSQSSRYQDTNRNFS
mmetsp:Transcript_9846/g.14910  ORF Transcript_9846/g.14910 Transcript_9846/m.14910 type:complete len:141 (+) Transcript_9846:160-582(+)